MRSLSQLKSAQLHQLAVALGTPCSGSKRAVIDGIRQALTHDSFNGHENSKREEPNPNIREHRLSIISIDMGIQNLAYAHLLVPHPNEGRAEEEEGVKLTILPTLRAWERLNVFPGEKQDDLVESPTKPTSYSPSRYATAAYHFISKILIFCYYKSSFI